MAAYATIKRDTLLHADERTIASLDAASATVYKHDPRPGGGFLGSDGVLVERGGVLLHAAVGDTDKETPLTGDADDYQHVTIEYDPTSLAAPLFASLDDEPRRI